MNPFAHLDGRSSLLMSRRRFAQLSAASIAAMLASGCNDVGSNATRLRFWNGFTGPDGPIMLRMIKAFNASQEDVRVTMQRMDWATYYNKLFVAGLGGRAPEIFVVHTDTLERFIRADFLAPVDSMFTAGVDVTDIDETVLRPAQRDNVTYALPLDVHPCGVFYNKRLFAEAGIARPPDTREEFIDALQRMRKQDGGAGQWGFVYEWLMVNLYTLLRQWDGRIVGEDEQTIVLDSQQAIESMEFAASLILDRKIVPRIENMNAFIGFRQGRIGMVWAGIFMLQELRKQKDLEFGAAVVPTVGRQRATWAGSHNLCMRADLDERHREAAERFFKFLSDHTLDWAEAGQVPVRKSLRDSDRFRAMEIQATFAKQIPYVQYMPSTPFTFEYQTEFNTAAELILRGTLAPAQALSVAATNIRRAAARFLPGPAPAQTPAGGGAA